MIALPKGAIKNIFEGFTFSLEFVQCIEESSSFIHNMKMNKRNVSSFYPNAMSFHHPRAHVHVAKPAMTKLASIQYNSRCCFHPNQVWSQSRGYHSQKLEQIRLSIGQYVKQRCLFLQSHNIIILAHINPRWKLRLDINKVKLRVFQSSHTF